MSEGEHIILITCEHAVNKVPTDLEPLFLNHMNVLKTHEAIDIGALEVATALHEHFKWPLFTATVSRLIVDCNRTVTHPGCFSRFTQSLHAEEKNALLQSYYFPYRTPILQTLTAQMAQQKRPIIHLSIHSFTPSLNGSERQADIGLLYDPRRSAEKQFARFWKETLNNQVSHLRVRLNYPYRGQSDGFATSLRKQFNENQYIGIELEMNQHLTNNPSTLAALSGFIIQSLQQMNL